MKKEKFMNNKLSDILASLIKDGKISKKTICIAADISEQDLDEYLLRYRCRLQADDIIYLDQLTMLLDPGLTLVSEEERIKSILENLLCDYGFTLEQLSRLLNMEIKILQNVMESKEVQLEQMLTLAVKESYLFYALKRGR